MLPVFTNYAITRVRIQFLRLAGIAVLLASLFVAGVARSTPSSADTVVLVNSASARYLDFRNLIQPYLDHFGIPYSVLDIRTNEVGTNIADFALIVIGHAQLDTNHLYLSSGGQSNIVQAVAAGVGLVNFDFVLSGSGVLTNYQYVQDIFGFSYPGGSTGNFVNTANFFATEPGGQLHYIVTRHPTNSTIAYRGTINLLNVTAPANVKVLARSGGQPLVSVNTFGQGRAVQWGSYDWVNMSVKGPIGGMDDLIWRGLIWAARKPFMMRGMPNLVSLRVDDTVGPSWWLGVANEVGLKPWLGPFITSMPVTNIGELRNYATNGLCTVSPHSFTPGNFVYWNHGANTNWSDTEISNRMYWARQWHITNGIPLAKVIVPHTYEVGLNAFPWFQQWGSEFFIFDNEPGTPSVSPWMVAGPFRKYVPTRSTSEYVPECYADFLNIGGHPELAGVFFNSTTVVQDDSPCGEWCPDNDVTATVGRGVRQLKRAFDSLAPGVLYTHEAYIQFNNVGPVYTPSITTNNWRTILQTLTNQIAEYKPQYVTLDYSGQYVRATRTAKITTAAFDPASGQMSMTFTGRADLNLSVQVYLGQDSSISNVTATIPAFTNTVAVSAPVVSVPPTITTQPESQTANAGNGATFTVNVTGSPPFSYQWRFNNTNIEGATNAGFSIVSVAATNAGTYSVFITNLAGTATSSNAVLTVLLPPAITNEPQSQTVVLGTNVTWTVGAAGNVPLTYQWRFNGADIEGATNVGFSITSVVAANAGIYSVFITNLAGTATSSDALLTVLVPPVITNEPQSQAVLVGASVTLIVGATGSEPLTYQWQKNATNFALTLTNALVLTNVQTTDTGDYSVIVTNAAGFATSSVAIVDITLPPLPPLILSGFREGDLFVISFGSAPGYTYIVEHRVALATGSWLVLTNIAATTTNSMAYDVINSSEQFYRAYVAGPTAQFSPLNNRSQGSSLVLVFNPRAGNSYTIEDTDGGGAGGWSSLTNRAAQTTNLIFIEQ